MLHPVRRRKTWRRPTRAPSPWMAEKTSVTRMPSGRSPVMACSPRGTGGVVEAGLGEALGPQDAGVAAAAGRGAGAVAGPGELHGGADVGAQAHDGGLGELDQGSAYVDGASLHAPLLAHGRHPAEGVDELGPAVGVAAVVQGVDAQIDG